MSTSQDLLEQGTGMVSHWGTALLQTAGMYGQSNVLEHGEFLHHLGTLFFAFAAISAVASVALYHDFRKLMHLIISPGLFLCVLTLKADVCSVRLQFGFATVDNSCERLKTPLREISESYYGGENNDNAHVSWFFLQFDKVISELVQKTVSVITETRDNKHLIKLARERLILRLSRIRTSNPAYQKFLSIALFGECVDAVSVALELAFVGQTDTVNSVIAAILNEDGSGDSLYHLNQILFGRLQDEYNLLKQQPVWVEDEIVQILKQSKFAPFINALQIDPDAPLTCEQVWQVVVYGAYLGANSFFNPSTDDKRILSPLFLIDNGRWDDEVVSEVVDKIYSGPEFPLMPGIIPTTTDLKKERAAMTLASFYLRNTIIFNKLGSMTVAKRRTEAYNQAASRIDYSMIAKQEAGSNALEVMHFAAYVPYLQGLLLYFLAFSFPFFALFLLIPGRQSTFFMWIGLWAWVKSWDVGFAMINVLRDIMWHLTPSFSAEHSLYGIDWYNGNVDFYNISSVIIMAFQNDPIGNLSMYFFIVSMFTIGVPIISAQIFVGASSLIGAVGGGIGNGMSPSAGLVDKSKGGSGLQSLQNQMSGSRLNIGN